MLTIMHWGVGVAYHKMPCVWMQLVLHPTWIMCHLTLPFTCLAQN